MSERTKQREFRAWRAVERLKDRLSAAQDLHRIRMQDHLHTTGWKPETVFAGSGWRSETRFVHPTTGDRYTLLGAWECQGKREKDARRRAKKKGGAS